MPGLPPVVARASRCLSGPSALSLMLLTSLAAVTSGAQFVSQPTRDGNILEGNWQSCRESPVGPYAERIYDHVVNGIGQFEVHLGPANEFAIFSGVQDEHREHQSPENLLKPSRVPMNGTRAQQRWMVPSLKLAFSVTLGGGARTDCESWYILLEPLDSVPP